MPDIKVFQVETFDVSTGQSIYFHSDLDKVKRLPTLFERDGCLPDKINVKSFNFNTDIYDSTAAMIRGALNRDMQKMPKLILTWSVESGWREA